MSHSAISVLLVVFIGHVKLNGLQLMNVNQIALDNGHILIRL